MSDEKEYVCDLPECSCLDDERSECAFARQEDAGLQIDLSAVTRADQK